MNRLVKPALAAGLAAMMAMTSLIPAQAAPLPVVKAPQVTSDVQQVQYRRHYERHGYYHGHRGYRDRRPGYRRHNDGWWYPLAAFGAGAIIGGAIAAPPPRRYPQRVYTGGNAHYQWCASRYRTYRASDNSYVPRVGYRAQCVSPYG